MHFGGLEDDRKDYTEPHIAFRSQLGSHRQCGLAICTFHLGFSLGSGGAPAKSQPLQVLRYYRVQALRLGLLLPPLGGQTGHLFLEGLAIVGLRPRADVPPWGEDVTVLADFLQHGALAEPGNVGIVAGAFPALPRQAW